MTLTPRPYRPWRLAALLLGVVVLVLLALVGAAYLVAHLLGLDRLVLNAVTAADEQLERPAVRVVVRYSGANPEVIEQVIAHPIEAQLAGIEGATAMRSESRDSECVLTVYFAPGHDIDTAIQRVRERCQLALPQLPADVEPPTVQRVNPDALPLTWLVLHADGRPLPELTRLAGERLRPDLLKVPGVGDIEIAGSTQQSLFIRLDPDKLGARDLHVSDVAEAVRKQNVGMPAGFIFGEKRGDCIEELNKLTVAVRNGQVVRLIDVAAVEEVTEPVTLARFDGKRVVALGIQKTPGFEAATVCEAVRQKLPDLRAALPPGVELTVATEGPVPGIPSEVLLLDLELPAGTNRDRAAELLQQAEGKLATLQKDGPVASVLAVLDPVDGFTSPLARCFIQLKPSTHRAQTAEEVRKRIGELPGIRSTVHEVVFRGGTPTRKRTFEVVVEWESIDELGRFTDRLRAALAESGQVTDLQSDDVAPIPGAVPIVDREKAARVGVSVRECMEALAVAGHGYPLGSCDPNRWDRQMWLVLGDRAGQGGERLRGVTVRGVDGKAVPLANLVEMRPIAGPRALYRYDGRRGVRITGNLAAGVHPDDAWATCRELVGKLRREMNLPDGCRVVPWSDFRSRVRSQ